MSTNESTYVLRVQAEIGDLSAKVAQAKASLDGLLKSGQAPKGLIQSFQQVETLLGKIQDASKAPPSKAMFTAMQKDVGKLGTSFSGLMRHIDDLKSADASVKMELIPDEEKEKLQVLIKTMSQYKTALKDIEEQERKVAKAKKDSEAASKASKRAKEDKVSKKNKLDIATGKRDAAQTKLAALDPGSEKDAKQIAALTAQITKLDAEIVALNRDYRQASNTLTEANKTAKTAQQAYTDMSSSLEAMKSSKLQELSSAARQAGVSFQSIDGASVSDELARLSTAMDQFKTETEDVGTVIDGANSNLGETPEKVKEVATSVEQASAEWNEYNEQQNKLKNAQERIKQFLGITGAVKLMTKAFRQAFNATKELDAAMQEIAVVTDFEISDMWDQMPQYAERANELGISITQAYKASALFYQQGLETNEVIALSNETLKMARIANLDAAEATDRMTAALRGFNMELNQTSAQQVADVYSKLAAITASDVDEISSAMTKTASIASSAGMEFETTAAFLSQIIETTRESAETAGTALKTVIARFQELKKDPAEIGEVDGESIDANQIETALRSVGVSLRDSSGQFRELDDVFMELSSKWDTLDKNTQRYIATIAAGSRQQSRFIAMMQDYNRTQELVTAANTSAGASAKQYEKTLESLETKLTKLENAWTEFSTGLLNNEAIKFGVDLITSFIEAINKATSSTEGWMGTISKIGVILALFRVATALFKQFQTRLVNFFTTTGIAIGNNIVAGMRSKEGEIVGEAEKIAKNAQNAASKTSSPKGTTPKSSTSSTTTQTTTTQTATGDTPTDQEGSQGGFKQVAGKVAKVAFAPQIGAYKAAKAIGAKNKEIARGIVSKSKLGGEAIESQEKAAVAEGFATGATQQITQANTAISSAEVGTDLAGLQGLGNDINALALPLDSMEQQFLEKMKAMGISTEEAKKEWQELMGEISNGESTAEQAVDKINSHLQEVADFSVGVDSDLGRLQVTEDMQAEAANRFTVATDDNPANTAGLTAIAGNVGGDMANTLAYNPEAQGMSASALPMEQIEMQFKEKMTNMGVSTDEVEQKWKELYDTIENGGGTAVDALEAINNELEETANQAEQAGSSVDSGMRRIKNTAGTSSSASESLEEQAEAQAKLAEQQNKAAETQQENEQKAEESQQKMIDGYKKMGATIANVGAGLTMAGVAMSGLGSKFEEAGMDVAADTFNILGSVLGGVGTAMSVVGSIMSFLTPVMSLLTTATTAQTAASGAQSVANGVESASWWSVMAAEIGAQTAAWPLLLITLAIMVAILVLVGVIMLLVAAFKAMEAASPEGQLKAAEEAAAKAGETAEKAAESYNNLVEALDNLDGKYKALEDLTRGTKEWNEAVRDINGSVVDLIQQYPELAAFAENKNGVLTIDMEDSGVQEVLKNAEASMVATQNASLQANLEVMRKQQDLAWSEMDSGSYVRSEGPDWGKVLLAAGAGAATGAVTGLLGGAVTAIVGGAVAAEQSIKENSREDNEKLAKALAAGDIVDTGSGFEASQETLDELGFTADELHNFYTQVGGATEDLVAFGKQLNEQEAQMEATYEAMASNIESLANTSGWSDEEIEAGQRLFDGDIYGELYEQNKAEMEDMAISGSNDYENLSQENKDLMLESVKEIYGDSASITDDGKIKYKDADGNWQNTDISNDEEQIRNLMIEKKTTQQATKVAEGSKQAIELLNKKLGSELGSKLYGADEGGALTKADIEEFKSKGVLNGQGEVDKAGVQKLWNSLSEDAKLAYANSFDAFLEDFENVSIADTIMQDAEDALKKAKVSTEIVDNLLGKTSAAFAKGLTKQTEAITESLTRQGREGELGDVMTGIATDLSYALDTVAPNLRSNLEADFASLDVSNLDDLKKFQISLVSSYGLSADAAQKLIDKIAGATLATSSLVTTIEVFGDLYQASQAVETALAKVAKLQWEYNQALKDGSGNVKQLIQDQLAAYQDAAKGYAEKYTAQSEDLTKLRAQSMDKTKFGGRDLSEFISINEDGSLDTSKGSSGLGLQDLLNSASSDEEREKIQDWVDNYNETWEAQQETLDGMRETVDNIQELEQQGKDAYYELRDMAKTSILGAMEKQIDIQQDTLDATKETNAQIISKIQEQIDDQRQARENEKMQEDLNSMYAQQAYLAADTSGANDLQAEQLDQQIADAEQSYEDTLIDQTIQTLSDANAKAEEQRERQIAIAERQLEAYEMSNEFQSQVDSMLNEMISADENWRDTELGQLMFEQYTEGMSSAEAKDWAMEIGSQVGAADAWKDTDWGKATEAIKTDISTLPTDLANAIEQGAQQKATRNQLDQLTSAGMGAVLEKAGITRNADGTYSGSGSNGSFTSSDQTTMDNIQAYANKNSETEASAESTYASISGSDYMSARGAAGYDTIMSSSEYYEANASAIASGEKGVKTYAEYVQQFADEKEQYDLAQKYSEQGAVMVDAAGYNDKENALFDLSIWDTEGQKWYKDIYVETGKQASNQSELTKLHDASYPTNWSKDRAYQGVIYGTGDNRKLFIRVSDGKWYEVLDEGANLESTKKNRPDNALYYGVKHRKALVENNLVNLAGFTAFKTGGLADFTGPAWLDGTKARPEMVLNQQDTQNFIALKDILADILDGNSSKEGKTNGDNYFEIEINVESIKDDYDVEQIANKIRNMIYEDASYRNVNAINNIR